MSPKIQIEIPVDEYRSIPIPGSLNSEYQIKHAFCYTLASKLPAELGDWTDVNPRSPKLAKDNGLVGPVASEILETLTDEPEEFAFRNLGIYLLVDDAIHTKVAGGKGLLTVTLSDPKRHGIVNGGHTFRAIQQVGDSGDAPDPWPAYVPLHLYIVGNMLDVSRITGMAQGLNRSLQVDDRSLENLRGLFDPIRNALEGKPGHDQISFRQGDTGPVDVHLVLTFMQMLNIETFPDRKSHPNKLFGQQRVVLENFVEDQRGKEGKHVYNRMFPHLHEILVLTDCIQQRAVKQPIMSRLKLNKSKTASRVRSEKNRNRPAHFEGGNIEGLFHQGWLYPMLAAFRANVSRKAWEAGKFEWLVEPLELLDATIEEMTEIIHQEHTENKNKPAEVGRKEAAYRACHGVLSIELASRGLLGTQ
jgi:AIPR protein